MSMFGIRPTVESISNALVKCFRHMNCMTSVCLATKRLTSFAMTKKFNITDMTIRI